MYNRRRPEHHTGKHKIVLGEEHFEPSQTYLARERRLVWLRGPVMGIPHRFDAYGPIAVHDSILAYNLDDTEAPIYVLIDSPGGLINDGLILYDAIKLSKAPVITVCQQAASMAGVIAAAGSERLIYPHARIMLHLPQAGVQGDVKEIEIHAEEMRKTTNILADMYIDCGVHEGREKLLEDMDREFWMGAEEAIKYGVVDRIITSEELMGVGQVG